MMPGSNIARDLGIAYIRWKAEGSEFESRERQDFSPFHVVQTGSGAHPVSYSMGTEDSFPKGKEHGA
jgi:hypothetical protein